MTDIKRTNWAIVLLGSFAPEIFRRYWLETNDLASKEAADLVEVSTGPYYSSLTLGSMSIMVQPDVFVINTESAPEVEIMDFVVRVFGQLLPNAKIRCFGINKTVQFLTKTPEDRVRLGRTFAPVAPWGEFGKRIDESKGELVGGLENMNMREVLKGDDKWDGHINAQIRPSRIDKKTGVEITVNNHFDIKNYKEDVDSENEAVPLIQKYFKQRMNQADEIINSVMENLK